VVPAVPPTVLAGVKPGLDLDGMRRAIAAAMARSWREIPHYFVSSTLDLTSMLDWLQRENAQRPVPERLHYAAPLIRAVALALKATPTLNGHYGEQGFEAADHVHLGVAVAMRGGGLIAPAILDADTRALPELMAHLDDLVARVRGGRLRSSEMSMATATLSNLGEETADILQPVIYPPQVAIIGCGQIAEHAWARDGALSARRTLTITVGGDHRVSDGRIAAKFLRRLDELLQQPERL
jgi:pyruvate dehydrogenase E2 component (dihydrolipoamide acetyltransferase)